MNRHVAALIRWCPDAGRSSGWPNRHVSRPVLDRRTQRLKSTRPRGAKAAPSPDAQLRGAGLTDARIGRWIRAGRLQRVHPAVYAIGPGLLTERGRLAAALLYAGPGAALSHAVGAWWLELLQIKPAAIDLCAPGRKKPLPGVIVHHPRAFERDRPRAAASRRRTHPDPSDRRLRSRSLRCAGPLRRPSSRGSSQSIGMWEAVGQGREGSAVVRRALASHLPQLAHTQKRFRGRVPVLMRALRLTDAGGRTHTSAAIGLTCCGGTCGSIVELDGKGAHTKPAQVARRSRARPDAPLDGIHGRPLHLVSGSSPT